MSKASILSASAALLLSATVAMAAPEREDTTLVLLHTNDTHSQLDPIAKTNLGGIARRKALIDSVKALHENVLVIDAGDAVQGTLFFNLYEGEVENKLDDALGYDYRTLGNHEFDNGMKGLRKQLEFSKKPQWLATNYKFKDPYFAKRFAPTAIREFGGKRFGIMALNLNPEGIITDGNYDGVEYVDLYDAANATAWRLKNVDSCDVVIAVTHIGYEPNATDTNDLRLAANSKNIDIILGGHSHTNVDPDAVHSRQPWLAPNAEGEMALIAQNAKGGPSVSEVTVSLNDLSKDYTKLLVTKSLDSKLDPKIEEIIAPYRHGVDSLMHLRVTSSPVELPQNSNRLLNFLADYMKIRGNELVGDVDLGMVNTGGVRADLPKGDISEGEIIMMLPFNNRIEVININGQDLIDNFDIMVGGKKLAASVSSDVDVVYDPITKKVTSLTINGKRVDPEKQYRLATIDYLANGGDYMKPLTRGRKVAASPNIFSTDFLKYLRKNYTKKPIPTTDKARIRTK